MLVKYEFLKILKRKSTLIVIAASLILTAVFFGLPVIQYQTYSREGVIRGSRVSGMKKNSMKRFLFL